MHRAYVALALSLSLLVVAGAFAAQAAGNASRGESLAKSCICHKNRGDLNGKPAEYLLEKMRAYKDGKLDNKPMIAMMQKLDDEKMRDLAAYYSGL